MNQGGAHRSFLFLQGPPGPLFRLLGEAMEAHAVAVHRINLSGGDYRDWSEGGDNYRGRFSDWPVYLDRYLRDHAVTDLMLFGDCRPYHQVAHGIAKMRGINIHVLEEGYLRPHWMTLEPDGVNGHSTLPRDKDWFLEQARTLLPEPELPPVTASFARRVRDSYRYYHHVFFGRWRFPHYRNHRQDRIFMEAAGWAVKFLMRGWRRRNADRTLAKLAGRSCFVLPLQLSGDYQIRTHSPFPDMRSAVRYVLESFAAYAPAGRHLVIKAHPLECGFFNWSRFVRRLARRLGVVDRVHFVDGGDLEEIAARSDGMVCVNSTSGTLALMHDKPVCTLGAAIYDIPGITHQGHIDSFWSSPVAPDPGVYPAFRRVLVERCLVRGGVASESAVRTLVGSILGRFGIAGERPES